MAKGNKELVANVLKTKPNLELKDEKGRSALMLATYNKEEQIVELLIKSGANVNAQDNMQNSPFLYAGATGYLDIVKMCLANGADFTVLDVVRLLVNTPGYPIDHINNLGWTALLEAIILGETGKVQTDIIQALVDAGSNVNIADNDGVSPLDHAKKKSMREAEKILREAGAK